MLGVEEIIKRAWRTHTVVPAFNVPYLPMIEPVIRAVVDADSFALIETARLEWRRFCSQGPAAVFAEFARWADSDHVRLHLDHVPVVDEDGLHVDYLPIIQEALSLGYHSVMVDGSRLDLDANITATRQVVELAHAVGLPCEGELGSVWGHEQGPLPPYEELFASGRGFTDIQDAERFVRETGCAWLSVAVGNVHGAVSGVLKDAAKVEARLDIKHLQRLSEATSVPLVLHGGSGVRQEYLLDAIKHGITKVNVGTEIRQVYEATLKDTGRVVAAQDAIYDRTSQLIHHYFKVSGSSALATG